MKWIFVAFLVLLLSPLPQAVLAEDQRVHASFCPGPASEKPCDKNAAVDDTREYETARQGCCSWHQGVCGCEGGRLVCCDGTYSPSCGC